MRLYVTRDAETAARIEWFNALRPGDKVLYSVGGGIGENKSIVAVKNRTATGKVRLENDELFDDSCYKYRKSSNGWGAGIRIEPLTDEFIRERERQNLAYYFGSKVQFGELPLEILRELQAIHNRPKEAQVITIITSEELCEGNAVRTIDNKTVFVHKILCVGPTDYPGRVYAEVLGEALK